MPDSLSMATLTAAASALPAAPPAAEAGSGDGAFAAILEEAHKEMASEAELGLVAQTLPLMGVLSPALAAQTSPSPAVPAKEGLENSVVRISLSLSPPDLAALGVEQAAKGSEGQAHVAVQMPAPEEAVTPPDIPQPQPAQAGTPAAATASSASQPAMEKALRPAVQAWRMEAAQSQFAVEPTSAGSVEPAQAAAAQGRHPQAALAGDASPSGLKGSVTRQGSSPDELVEAGAAQRPRRSPFEVRGEEARVSLARTGPAGSEPSGVGPAPRVDNQAAKILAHLVQSAEMMERSGQTSLRLQLNSDDLGRVEVWLTAGQQGVHITLRADAAQTGEMLQRHLPELRQSLAQAGVHLAGLNIGGGGASGQHNNAQLACPHPGFPWAGGRSNPHVVEVNEPPRRLLHLSTSQIDYLI